MALVMIIFQIKQMMAFIDLEAREKVEEIDTKVDLFINIYCPG